MPIQISKIIVHKLNILQPLPILSDQCININSLEDPQGALDFFVTHIEQSRRHGFVKKCQFWDLPDNTVKRNVETIISNLDDPAALEEAFIAESKRMALKFAQLMRQTSSRSDGSLFVLLYSIDGQNYIGIMKMDPDTGVEVMNDLTIRVRKDMLPSKREKLHKAAFIKCLDEFNENELHLFALDRQKDSQEPAKFFMDNFLNAKVLPGDESLTIEYQKTIANIFQDVLPPAVYMEFSQRFQRRLTRGGYFTLEEDFPILIRDLLPEDQREADLEYYTRTIQDRLVERHPGEVTGFTPVIEKVNDTVFQTREKSIKIIIDKEADTDDYEIDFDEDRNLVLKIFSEAGPKQIK